MGAKIKVINRSQRNFFMAPNAIFDRDDLSTSAKYMLLYFLSCGATFEVYPAHLEKKLNCRKDRRLESLRELREAGIITVTEQGRGNAGKYAAGTIYSIDESKILQGDETAGGLTGQPQAVLSAADESAPITILTKITKQKQDSASAPSGLDLFEGDPEHAPKPKYAFEGKVIRLTDEKFAEWLRLFPNLSLEPELVLRDQWLSEKPEKAASWYHSTFALFTRKDADAKNRPGPGKMAETEGGDIFNLQPHEKEKTDPASFTNKQIAALLGCGQVGGVRGRHAFYWKGLMGNQSWPDITKERFLRIAQIYKDGSNEKSP